jgi:hypothetical protein
MRRRIAVLLLTGAIISCDRPQPGPVSLSVCDLSKDFGAYRGKLVAVRGVYYYGLRQNCPQKCATGPWPSFLDLVGTGSPASDEGPVAFNTDDASWAALHKVQQTVERDAKQGKRLEIWVTAVGQLRTGARRSPAGPCDRIGSKTYGYGHLGVFPAQLVVKQFIEIEVRTNPNSPYDYSNMYHGAL